ncbi:hypothetical protein A3K80_05050 [Candidatus Bathyarchaeota archaeon RBG_13_38_9]|nr:MAG: hypothetical protein A3K80_05050 [Candidatus Bathyarchaeota archaeon RBG_13_38_9]
MKLKTSSEPIHQYITTESQGKDKFMTNRSMYKLNLDVIKDLKQYSEEVVIFAFSAEWCPDCHRNIPVLDLLNEVAGIEVRIFGHLMRDSKNHIKKWKIPPSPQEVEVFNVEKIPLIIILSKNGEELGRIVENPPLGKTIEQTILEIIKK